MDSLFPDAQHAKMTFFVKPRNGCVKSGWLDQAENYRQKGYTVRLVAFLNYNGALLR